MNQVPEECLNGSVVGTSSVHDMRGCLQEARHYIQDETVNGVNLQDLLVSSLELPYGVGPAASDQMMMMMMMTMVMR